MQKIVTFNIAKFLYTIGYREQTELLYLTTKPGIKARVTNNEDNSIKGEKIFYEGSLEKRDEFYGITYPSSHWIPAPFVFDAVKYIDENYNIRIIPKYYNVYYTYLFIVDNQVLSNLKGFEPTKSYTVELCYEHAILDIMKLVDDKQIKLF